MSDEVDDVLVTSETKTTSRLASAKSKGSKSSKKDSMKNSKSANASLFEASSSSKQRGALAASSSSIPRGLNTMTPSESDEEDLESTPVISNAPTGAATIPGSGASEPTAPLMGTTAAKRKSSAASKGEKNNEIKNTDK